MWCRCALARTISPSSGDSMSRESVGGGASCYLARVGADFVPEERRRYADAPLLPGEGKVRLAELLPKAVQRIEIEIGPGEADSFSSGSLAARTSA